MKVERLAQNSLIIILSAADVAELVKATADNGLKNQGYVLYANGSDQRSSEGSVGIITEPAYLTGDAFDRRRP